MNFRNKLKYKIRQQNNNKRIMKIKNQNINKINKNYNSYKMNLQIKINKFQI